MSEHQQKILFVEDESDQILVVQLRLEANGFQVLSTTDAEAGVRMAHEEQPSLILLDLLVQGANGLDICKRLKQSPETRGIPLIIFAGSSARNLEGQCRAAGADACVRKPYESSQLVATIKHLIERRSAAP
jgi:two-component system phosphate regulon response regulator PhoB